MPTATPAEEETPTICSPPAKREGHVASHVPRRRHPTPLHPLAFYLHGSLTSSNAYNTDRRRCSSSQQRCRHPKGFPRRAFLALLRSAPTSSPRKPRGYEHASGLTGRSPELRRNLQPTFPSYVSLAFTRRAGPRSWRSGWKGSVQKKVAPPHHAVLLLVSSSNSPSDCVFISKPLVRNYTNWITLNHNEFAARLIHKTNGRAFPLDLLILWRGVITQRLSTRERISLSAFKPFDEVDWWLDFSWKRLIGAREPLIPPHSGKTVTAGWKLSIHA